MSSVLQKNGTNFSDPVYQKLSKINGEINRMNKDELIKNLKQFKLDSSGTTDILKRRLKSFIRERKVGNSNLKSRTHYCPYKFLCIIDFEATCEGDKNTEYAHEIIEFPAVLVDTSQNKVVAEFQEYCKPVINPKLTEFCKELTGISQELVDSADIFPDVLSRFHKWLDEHHLGTDYTFAVVTDGPYDMGRFLALQCNLSNIDFPKFGKKWINIRKPYSNFYKTKRYPLSVMLQLLGMDFIGHPHCGLDDSRNIAKIAIKILQDGGSLRINEQIKWNSRTKDKEPTWSVLPVSKKSEANEITAIEKTRSKLNSQFETNIELIQHLDIDPSIDGSDCAFLQHCMSKVF